MMIVVSHREHLAAGHPEGAFTPCFFLNDSRKSQANLPQPPDYLVRLFVHPRMRHRRSPARNERLLLSRGSLLFQARQQV
jgi:hypothetical protein